MKFMDCRLGMQNCQMEYAQRLKVSGQGVLHGGCRESPGNVYYTVDMDGSRCTGSLMGRGDGR